MLKVRGHGGKLKGNRIKVTLEDRLLRNFNTVSIGSHHRNNTNVKCKGHRVKVKGHKVKVMGHRAKVDKEKSLLRDVLPFNIGSIGSQCRNGSGAILPMRS